eukprot:TRINITY_DN951_c0_g1::TRINITY_DN951_c0_g1_i1::g.15968::m.15968 TRINITY_DN951_c0_g1::TRINITY_DN951_c0_g1_i1::g.15968  ORF type:complete len:389 (+),score=134.00,Ycf1/PF05758.7/11 TRINITY_DN951_c0_g1_i1:57-1223(+)
MSDLSDVNMKEELKEHDSPAEPTESKETAKPDTVIDLDNTVLTPDTANPDTMIIKPKGATLNYLYDPDLLPAEEPKPELTEDEIDEKMMWIQRGSVIIHFKDENELEKRRDDYRTVREQLKDKFGIPYKRRGSQCSDMSQDDLIRALEGRATDADVAFASKSGKSGHEHGEGKTLTPEEEEARAKAKHAEAEKDAQAKAEALAKADAEKEAHAQAEKEAKSKEEAAARAVAEAEAEVRKVKELAEKAKAQAEEAAAMKAAAKQAAEAKTRCTCGFLESLAAGEGAVPEGDAHALIAHLRAELAKARAELDEEKRATQEAEHGKLEALELLVQSKLELAILQEELVKNNNVLHRSLVDRHALAKSVDDLKCQKAELEGKRKKFSFFSKD